MKNAFPLAAALLAAALVAGPAAAQHADYKSHAGGAAAADADLTDAEVRRVDPAQGTIMLKHGEIRNLGMGAMTMGFKLRDPKLADGLKAGDRVRFSAVQEGETLVVTRLVRQR